MDIQNVLASRYASPRMCRIWSAENKIIAERRLWLAVMEAQRDLGVDFGGDDAATVIADYERVLDQVDLASIDARERVTHDQAKHSRKRQQSIAQKIEHRAERAGLVARPRHFAVVHVEQTGAQKQRQRNPGIAAERQQPEQRDRQQRSKYRDRV